MSEMKKFPLITGIISLDFINTEVVRRGQRHNLLSSETDVKDWLYGMKDYNPTIPLLFNDEVEVTNLLLNELLKFRSLLREAFDEIADGKGASSEFLRLLERKIEAAPFSFKVSEHQIIPLPVGKIEDSIISLIAYDVLKLVEGKKLNSLKRCSNPECVLLFIDEGGRRKWCSMKICGNRKKVARYQQKEKER